MNYCEIDINNQKVGFLFGLTALSIIGEGIKQFEGANQASINMASVVEIFHAGYENNCIYERIKPSLSYKDFFNFVEDEMWEAKGITEKIQLVLDTFATSKKVSKVQQNGTMEAEKKN